ncbi:hypothetical protein [Fructilactobacillus sanfranciscensis]|uniref:hypothetical protein n=1 Tax=Fructilactobacillus sanfranciscensis TaxID=1625 RepID=UPI0037E0076C
MALKNKKNLTEFIKKHYFKITSYIVLGILVIVISGSLFKLQQRRETIEKIRLERIQTQREKYTAINLDDYQFNSESFMYKFNQFQGQIVEKHNVSKDVFPWTRNKHNITNSEEKEAKTLLKQSYSLSSKSKKFDPANPQIKVIKSNLEYTNSWLNSLTK